MPMRNMYPNNIQSRPGPQIMPPSFATNQMLTYNNGSSFMYGNQPFGMPAIAPANYNPVQAALTTSDVQHRKKSIIENINPFIGESKNSPAEILKSFPVSKKNRKIARNNQIIT